MRYYPVGNLRKPKIIYFSTMKRILGICLLLSSTSFAQTAYWQQHVATHLEVKLDDKLHILNGYEELTYTNNSPDTLRIIYMHLFANAYRNDRTPFARQQEQNRNSDFYYSKPSDRGYIDSLQFTVNGAPADHYTTEAAPDIARLDLPKPLYPGQSIKIATPFRVKLPKVFSRSGHTGQAYYVAQWFPKPAVYDRKGWHPISYLDQGEFFSEYGTYDVAITVPSNYVVMATGNCTDAAENAFMDSLAAAPLPSDTLYRRHFPASALTTKTIHFQEDNVHDFAWFADKRYIVRKDTVTSPGSGKVITTWTAFTPPYQHQWANGNKYLADAVHHYGKWVGPYPYNTIKAALGDMKAGGGMEYPTLTLIDRVASAKLETVVVHEAGHNWFYGMLGSNERDHAWMDEGLNSFYEQKTTKALHPDSTGKRKSVFEESLIYYQLAQTNEDQAINNGSAHFRNMINYGLDVYYKSALMLGWLEEYMGPATFEKAMKAYFSKWCFAHPYPEDFRAVMQQHTDKDLSWFFDTILNTDRPIDYRFGKIHKAGDKTEVTIVNRTGITAPVKINAVNAADSVVATVWTEPFAHKTITTIPSENWTRLRIDDIVPDARTANNEYRRHALLHRYGLALKPVLGLNRSYKDKLFIAPALAQNSYDGIMAGLLLHNLTVPENRFAYAIAPMYSFNTGTVTGAASVGYSFYPRKTFRSVMLVVDGKTFHDNSTDLNLKEPIYARFTKVAPSISFTFKERNPLSNVTRNLTLKQYNISEESINFGTDSTSIPVLQSAQNIYGSVRYSHRNDRMYNPFSYAIQGHGNADFAKISAEGNLRIDYYAKKKALHVRGYIGKFFGINSNPAVTQRYWLNASYSGINDYLYDGTYRARMLQDGFQGQQISPNFEGGFKVPIYNGAYRTDNWLAALNLKTDLPKIGLPIRLFLDAGLMPNPNPGFKNVKATQFFYDGGIEIYLSKEVAFYFPLVMSDNFRNSLSSTFGNKNVFVRSISFTLELHNINWLRTPARIIKTVSGG